MCLDLEGSLFLFVSYAQFLYLEKNQLISRFIKSGVVSLKMKIWDR